MTSLADAAVLDGTATETAEPVSRQTTALAPRPAAQPPAAVTPMAMLQMAIERGADVAMLERLMALQERWEANEARKAFIAALSAFKADPPTVVKNKSVAFGQGDRRTAYDHATLDQVASVIGAALAAHGLAHR